MKRRSGFTLMEILIVVALLSLLLLLFVWNFPALRNSQTPRALAEEMAGKIQDLRSQAQSRHLPTALGWASDGEGRSRSSFVLTGGVRAELKQLLPWHERYSAVTAFTGSLGNAESWPNPADAEGNPRDWVAWAGPWAQFPLLIFTPSGEVVGLNWPQVDGCFTCVLGLGLTSQPLQLQGRPLARLSQVHRGVALKVLPSGSVAIDSQDLAGLDPARTLPVGPVTSIPPSLPALPLQVHQLDIQPQQNPEFTAGPPTLPRRARVEPEAYLHLRVHARGSGHEPLRCLWTANRGQASSSTATAMIWNGTGYEATWEWQAPFDSQAGDRFELNCEVRNARGEVAAVEVETRVDVEIIKPSRVLFSSMRGGQPDLYMVNRDGSRLRRLTHDPALEGRPHISPDGSRIFYSKEGSLYIADSQGDHPQVLLTGDSYIEPAWNPLGTKIVVNRRNASGDALCIVDADPQNPNVEVVTTFPHEGLGFLDWSPDNSRLVYNTVGAGGARLYEYIFASATHRPLRATPTSSEFQARFSPDGQQLAFSRREGGSQIWVANYRYDTAYAAGRLEDDRAVVVESSWNSDPAWSPDGQFLVFGSRRPGGAIEEEKVWIQSPNSSQAQKLSQANERDWDPTWGR